MIERIEVRGKLIHECRVPGETRADDVFPGHPNGMQVARDRWLLLVATRGWRRVDDDRSILYQLRKDRPDGDLLREGMIRPTADDWDALGDGTLLSRNQGHPVCFGVPKGALIGGRPARHANVFAAKWRVSARWPDDLPGAARGKPRETDARGRTQFVEWMQFRLNDAGDDIEMLQPPRVLRQVGYEEGDRFCSREDARWMNQAFSSPVPFNGDATEWVDCNHFDGGRVAPLKYRFDPSRGLYEWVETGPYMRADALALSEASIARAGDAWLICARGTNAIGWVRTDDPFRHMPPVSFTTRPAINSPVTMYACADRVVRIFTGDVATSPYGHGRCPLYCWDVDPQTFAASNHRTIHDPIAAGILPRETGPRAEMCKLLPHAGGREQWLLWRVRTKNIGVPYGSLPPVTPEWKEQHGIYCGVLIYSEDRPAAWRFA